MRPLFLCAALAIATQSTHAQTVSGVITGTVKDPTEAVVVNAGLTLGCATQVEEFGVFLFLAL
jgi:hypothetical protein